MRTSLSPDNLIGFRWVVAAASSIILVCALSAEMRATIFFAYACKQVQFTSHTTGWIIGTRGIYKTEDGGVTWRQLQTLPNHLSFGIPRPNDSNGKVTVEDPNALGNGAAFSAVGWFVDDEFGYYGSADGTGGLVRTTDGGDSWTELLPGILRANGFEQQFNDGRWGIGGMSIVSRDIGWFLIDYYRLYGVDQGVDFTALSRTTDGGATFDTVLLNLSTSSNFLALDEATALVTSDHRAALHGLAVFRTRNGGQTWAELARLPCTSWQPHLQRAGSTAQVVCSDVEDISLRIFRSSDRGSSWGQAGPRGVPPWEGPLSGAQFSDHDHGWYWWGMNQSEGPPTVLSLCRTRNGGQTWQCRGWTYPATVVESMQVFFIDSEIGWMVIGGRDYNYQFDVFRTEDGGKSWRGTYAGLSKAAAPGGLVLHFGYSEADE